MLVRILVLFALFCGFSVHEGFAMQSPEHKAAPRRSTRTTLRKIAIKKPEEKTKVRSEQFLPRPVLVTTTSSLPSEVLLSPVSTEKMTFSKVRPKFALLKSLKEPISSPYARKKLLKAISSTPHFEKFSFRDKVVYRASSLFNWNDLVLTLDPEVGFKWETNLERTLRGAPPIAAKGIGDYIPLDKLDAEEAKIIRARQRPYIVQLHHLTQRDGKENERDGASKNPLIWITSIGHRSGNACIILEMNKMRKPIIVHKDLTKEEAEKKCLPHQWISKDNLHFRGPKPSQINRSKFDGWREKHWKSEGKAELKKRASKKHIEEDLPLRMRKLNFGSSTLDDDGG